MASARLDRPATPLAFEVRPSVMVSSSRPALAAVSASAPVLPAAMAAGLTRARLPLVLVPTTASLSWKAAVVTTGFVTLTALPVPVRRLPSDKLVVSTVAEA